MTAKITVDNLRVVFPGRGGTGPVEAVAGLTLEVGEGELVCVVGPSGCGKTTLLRVLAELEEPTGGTATILDFEKRLAGADNKVEVPDNPKSKIQNPKS
ncbi:MAG: ATP-binding cassette domain-containing protein, partial [Chloroflexia bacterium]